ncbi:TlpA family protein disulfide reductase [Undibacterium sp. Rencai35W]|uniref:TlpA family protein disulfide reductase n=1 Tax=Undibacterium sp. Rencai35W TaxID=3413046 RepID=UPI003BF3C6F4
MSTLLNPLRILFAVFLLCAHLTLNAAEVGKTAPEAVLQGVSTSYRLSDFKGKLVYLDFWASWCGPCKKSFPWMNVMQSKYGSQGFKIIAVNVDTDNEDWKNFLAAVPANFDIALDPKGAVAKLFDIKGMPTSVLVSRDGKVIAQHAGFNDETRNRIEKEIQLQLEVK